MKIIKASAGTGKTYRLSLEFISILLKNRNLKVSEILAITFTKKATAEIKNRIYQHLEVLIYDKPEKNILIQNLKQEFKIDLSPLDIVYLKKIYEEIQIDKEVLKIFTIDAFIQKIFSGIVAPYLNINNFSIDDTINKDYLDEIYSYLFNNHEDLLGKLFFNKFKINLRDYDKFIFSIINNRYIFLFKEKFFEEKFAFNKQVFWDKYLKEVDNLLYIFDIIAEKKNIDLVDLLKNEYKNIFFENKNLKIDFFLKDKLFIKRNYKILLEDNKTSFLNGIKLRGKDIFLEREDLLKIQHNYEKILADYLFVELLLEEDETIENLAKAILEVYDEIKFREKIFTYNDITYYCFSKLYDEKLSVLEKDSFSNEFYELLTFKIRFLLIDEFQDTSVIQFKLLQPIINELIAGQGQKNYGDVIVVGDEKQAIYSWRGGDYKLLKNLNSIYENNSLLELNTCYRSCDKIIAYINELFTQDFSQYEWNYKKCNSTSKDRFANLCLHLEKENIDYHKDFVERFILQKKNKSSLKNSAIICRKNKNLEKIAKVLDFHKIPYILESSKSIFSHRAIKPIIYFMEYLLLSNNYNLLRFLRSDLVLIDGNLLKKILNSQSKDEAIIKKINSIVENFAEDDLLFFLKDFLEKFNYQEIYDLENDWENISFFITILNSFHNQNYPNNLKGFLDFVKREKDKTEYEQIGIGKGEFLFLLSIHKAKGLEFDNVFFFHNFLENEKKEYNDFSYYYDFNEDFSKINQMFFVYNYEKILAKSSFSYLTETKKLEEERERLNYYYVALTRAKNNLFMYFVSKEEKKEDIKENLNKNFVKIIEKIDFAYSNEIEEQTEAKLILQGKVKEYKINDLFSAKQYYSQDKIIETFKEEKKILTGLLNHYYLYFIKSFSQKEMNFAKEKTYLKYGNYFSKQKIDKLIDKLNSFIQKNLEFFNYDAWDLIFNEFVLSSGNKNFRIDKLLINNKEKKVFLLDFKSGFYHEENQLINYKNLLLNLIKDKSYKIYYKFLFIG